jgi:acetyl-CoA carboxylase biotin carboxylase subunit
MTQSLRQALGEAAAKLATACDYHNAGTIEFLVTSDGHFYFLEMNTRLQVEHPITEMVTGVDLVREQIRIAAGQPLSLLQSDIHHRGSALECRIYAEDAENHFLPSPGKITYLMVPAGPGVRDDSGIYDGWTVPVFYDALLSKLVTWGNDRNQAIERMRRALDEYRVGGIKTTVPFFQSLLRHPEFLSGNLSTDFLSKHYSGEKPLPKNESERNAAAVAAALYNHQKSQRSQTAVGQESPWKLANRLNLRRSV